MASKKYLKDYKLIHSVDEKGRIRSSAEYAGGDYAFEKPSEEVRAASLRCAAAAALAWACFAASLFLNTGAMRLPQVSLPYAFTAVPLWFLASCLISALRAKENLRHRQADDMDKKIPASAMWAALLPLLSLFGMAVALIFSSDSLVKADILFAFLDTTVCAASAYCFKNKDAFKTKKLQ